MSANAPSTQAYIDQFLARGGQIQRIPLGKRNYNERDMRNLMRGESIETAKADVCKQARKHFDELPDEAFSAGVRIDFNGDEEVCTVLA